MGFLNARDFGILQSKLCASDTVFASRNTVKSSFAVKVKLQLNFLRTVPQGKGTQTDHSLPPQGLVSNGLLSQG